MKYELRLSGLLPTQRRFLMSAGRYPAYIGGYGCGKTYVNCLKGILLALENAPLPGMIVAPTYGSLRDYTLIMLKHHLGQAFGEPIPFDYHRTDKVMTLFSSRGQRRQEGLPEIWLRSGDDPDSLRGPTLAWAGVDEVAQQKREIWGMLLSRVRHPEARRPQVFATGTPDEHWVAELWEEDPAEGYELFRASTLENVYMDDDYIQGLRSSHSEDEQARIIEGRFVRGGTGRAYKPFDRATHVAEESPFEPGADVCRHLPLCLACDFNVDPCVWLLLQSAGGVIYVLDEIVGRDTNTPEMIDRLRGMKRYWNHRPLHVYGDPSGKARVTAASMSDYVLMRRAGLASQRIARKAPPVKDRVMAVNARLRSGDGKVRLFVHPRCKALIKDMEWVRWREGRSEIDKSNGELTHASDALGYFIHYEYPLRRPAAGAVRVADVA